MIVLFPLGVLVLAVVAADFVQTTLGAQRAGRVTRGVTAFLWRAAVAFRRACGPAIHRYVGPVILATMTLTWGVLHWVGWTLIHVSVESAVVTAEGEPAGFLERLAYVGASISTLGQSMSQPGGPVWDVPSTLAALNGMVVVTLSVAFVINVTQAVTKAREFAVLVNAHGGEAFEDLRMKFTEVASQINAFPMALYFSLPEPERRAVPAIRAFVEGSLVSDARLDEMRPLIATLPGVRAERGIAEVLDEVARWSMLHSLDAPAPPAPRERRREPPRAA